MDLNKHYLDENHRTKYWASTNTWLHRWKNWASTTWALCKLCFFFFNNKTKNYNCLLSPQKTGERKLTSICVVYTRVPICYLKELLNHFVHTVVDSHPLILIICAAVGAILSATDTVCTLQVHDFHPYMNVIHGNWHAPLMHDIFLMLKVLNQDETPFTLRYCIRWGSGEWCHLYCAFQCSPITWCQQHRSAYSIKIVGDLPLPLLHQYCS